MAQKKKDEPRIITIPPDIPATALPMPLSVRGILDTLQNKLNEYEREREAITALHEGLAAIQEAESRVVAANQKVQEADAYRDSIGAKVLELEKRLESIPLEIEQVRRDGLAAIEVEFGTLRAKREGEITTLDSNITALKDDELKEQIAHDVAVAARKAEISALNRDYLALKADYDAIAQRFRKVVA